MRRLFDDLVRDIRHALRGIFRGPGFAAAVILTLGLGIGANAAMFSVVDQLMFRPYPMLTAPDAVHRVYTTTRDARDTYTNSYFEYTRFLDFRKWTTTFDRLAAFAYREYAVGQGAATQKVQVGLVSASIFGFFSAPPVLGRYFTDDEDQTPRGADVAVLSYEFWQNNFGGGDVLNSSLRVGDMTVTVIGVAAKGLETFTDREAPSVYIPITTYAGSRTSSNGQSYYTTYNWSWFQIAAQRKAGVTQEEASADLTQAFVKSYQAELEISPRSTAIDIARPTAVAAAMRPGAGPEPGLEARTALWVSGVSIIVLLIACANVANLYLARSLRRQRETAVRIALGVERGRLVRQVLTEGLVLATLGGGVGILVAQWGGAGIRQLLITDGSGGLNTGILTDWRTIAATGAATLLTGLLTALLPALFTSHSDLAGALKSGSRDGSYQRSRLRTTLLVTQFALSFVLLVGAGLFVRSLNNVEHMRIGFDTEPIVMVNHNLRGAALDDSARLQLVRTLLEATQNYPGVEAAAAVSTIPFWSTSSTSLFVAGIDSVRALGRFTYQQTTPDYFRTAGTRILRGRGIDVGDRAGAPLVAVVSEGMANVLWPGEDAIGKCMRVSRDTMPCTTVVGIAENIVQQDLRDPDRFQYYLPAVQHQPTAATTIYARMIGDPATQQEGLRLTLQKLMPGDGYIETQPLREIVRQQQGSWRLGATMFVAFGILALVVAAVGLYGVIGYNVAQRMHELGVRIALGAENGHIVRLVIGQSARFAFVGIAAGAVLAYVAGRWLEPLLFEQSARDPIIFAAVTTVLLLVTLIASAAPALRAVRADPATALRSD